MTNPCMREHKPFTLLFSGIVQGSADQKFKREKYQYFTAEFVLEGMGWLTIDGKTHLIEAGDMYILPPGRNHEYIADHEQPWKKIFFNAGGALTTGLFEYYPMAIFHFPDWENSNIFSRILELYENLSDSAHTEAALLFHKLIALAYSVQPAQRFSQPVASAYNFIKNNLQNRVRLADIAKASFLSPSQLSRLFKKETGYTPYSFLYAQRIEMAKHLLRNTDCRISDVAHRLQFSDQFYFSSAFKNAVGCSPREYQKGAVVYIS